MGCYDNGVYIVDNLVDETEGFETSARVEIECAKAQTMLNKC